ncbi:MAG: HNH endonuclease signature motif containing protein, partial [Mycobacteriales bacterium]
RRICCDAQVARIITDGPSEILDAGRAVRTHTPAMKRALIVRDGQYCVVPGCTVPTRWAQVHHLKHWAYGGQTDLANLAHVCLHHHHDLHEGRMTLHRQPDGSWHVRKRE